MKWINLGRVQPSSLKRAEYIQRMRSCKKISLNECSKIVKAMKKVLRYAIKMGGTTLKDFYSADGSEGYFSLELKVYGRNNEKCKHCDSEIKKIIIGQRATFYCEVCQY